MSSSDAPEPVAYELEVEGEVEIWAEDLKEQEDPVDAVKRLLEPLSFEGTVRLK